MRDVREVHVVAAVLRRGGELLMIRQAPPGEEPYWSIPAGRVEPGELVVEGLVRELREETGLEVAGPGALAFVCQVDDRRDPFLATIWTWEPAAWTGELAPADPDMLVVDAGWLSVDEAVAHLRRIAWQALTVGYLEGRVPPGTVWARRVHEDGREELLGPFGERLSA